MRTRHLSALLGSLTLVVLSVVGLRSCGNEPAGSPANPATFTRDGIGGVCAEQDAVAQADGGTVDGGSSGSAGSQALLSPQAAAQLQASNPQAYAALSQATGGSLSCPTSTAP
jgi:hypothetical protein